MLRDDTIAVGRAEDSQIVLDYEGVDPNHMQITRQGEGAGLFALSAESDTFVDGLRLPQDQPVVLLGGEEIQIGPLRAVFRRVDDSPTSPLPVVIEDTQRIIRESAPFRIELQLPQISVTPGSYITVEISVTNTSPEPERYLIEVSGLNPEWVKLNRPMIEVDSGDTGLVMMNIRPMRRSDSLPGEYPVAVVVRPEAEGSLPLRAMLTVRVLPFIGMGIALGSYRLNGAGAFRLHIHNHGSAPVGLRLSARDVQGRLTLRLAQTFAQMGPGERLVISGTAAPRQRRLFGAPRDIPFELIAKADALPGFTVAVPAMVADKPPLPAWSRLAVAVGGLLALLLIVWGIWGLITNRPIVPTISSFVVAEGAPEIARGLPLRVEWDVQDAEQLTLQVGSADPEVLPERGPGIRELVTSNLSGPIVLRLTASHGQQSVTSEKTVLLFRPATISELTVQPASVLRNVVQTLSVRWDAEGYVTEPLLTGLDALGQPAQIMVEDPAVPVEFVALPQQDFTVALIVVDERGQQSIRTADVALIDPQCTIARPSAPVFSAPDSAQTPAELLDQGVARIVLGRDESGQFVALQPLREGVVWVRASDLACPAELFSIMDLRTILTASVTGSAPSATVTQVAPPLRLLDTATPTETPTQIPSATPTPTSTSTSTAQPTVTSIPPSPLPTTTQP
jgi:pSer/pThr/pTyr-binding forkhead associated (FHA) protein